MADVKPFKTYEEQLELLISRGLKVPDRNLALDVLKKRNYYRLSAYSLTMRYKDGKRDRFYEGSSFEQIVQLYDFDDAFRQAIAKSAAIVEINLRSYLSYYLAEKYGPSGYLDASHFENEKNHNAFLEQIEKDSIQRKDELFVKHHKNDLGGIYPIWVLVEILSFGDLSKLYRNMMSTDRDIFSRRFYNISSRKYIDNWIHCAVVARNTAAHGGRFYNRPQMNPPTLLPKRLKPLAQKPFAYVYVIFNLLSTEDRLSFVCDIENAFKDYPYALPQHLGFPDDWKDILRT